MTGLQEAASRRPENSVFCLRPGEIGRDAPKAACLPERALRTALRMA